MFSFTKNWSDTDWIKNILTLALPILVCIIPCNDVYTLSMKLFFASTLMAILCFAFGNVPMAVAALILPVFWVVTGVAEPATVFSPWTKYTPWYILSGLILAQGLESTGLLKRFAYFCIYKIGGTYTRIIIGIMVAGVLGTLFLSDITMPMAALCFGLCKALKLDNTKAAAAIMLTGAFSTQITWLINFTSPIMMVGLGEEITGPITLLGFFEAWYVHWPLLLCIILTGVFLIMFFKPQEKIDGSGYFKENLEAFGKVSLQEKKAIVIAVLYLAFLISGGFGGRVSLEWGMIAIPMLFMVPGIGVGGNEIVKQLNFNFIIFVASCMGIGAVSVELGVGELIVTSMAPILEGTSSIMFLFMEWVLCFLSNFVMTPVAICAAFTVPLTSLGQTLGINPLALYQIMNFGIDQLLLPYESAMYLIFFSYGIVRMKDFIQIMSVKTIICTVVTFAVLVPWWAFVGFLTV